MPSSLLRLSVETRGRRRVEAVEWTKVGCSKTKKRRHSLQCYAHGAHPAPAAPCGWAVRLILLRPTVSAFPIQSLGSPVQSSPDCPVLSAVLCCAVLRSALSLSPFPTTPPDFLLLNLRLLLGTTDEPVARRHSPSPIRVPVRGHADDKVFLEPIDSTSPSPLRSPSSLQQPASQTVSITSLRNTQCSIPATGAVTSQTPHTDLASIVHRPPSLRLHRPSVLFSTPASHTKKLTTSNNSSSSLSQPSHAVVAPRVWVSFPARSRWPATATLRPTSCFPAARSSLPSLVPTSRDGHCLPLSSPLHSVITQPHPKILGQLGSTFTSSNLTYTFNPIVR